MRKKHLEHIQESSLELDLKLTAKIHRDGEWYVAFCSEMPGANGQGRTTEECLQSLKAAVLLLMEDQREDAVANAAHIRTLQPA
jgi:predicted RNase H-like HicB family nuclease